MALKDENILSIGMISIALGLLIGRFVHFEYSGFSVSDFLEGVLVGLSLVMNLTYLIRQKLKKKQRDYITIHKEITRLLKIG